MAIRTEEEVFGSQTKIVPTKISSVSGTNPYDSVFGLNRDNVSMSSPSTPAKISNPYDSVFGLNREGSGTVAKSTTSAPSKQKTFLGYDYANRPTGYTTGQEIVESAKYAGSKLAEGVNWLTNSFLSLPDSLWRLWSGVIVGNTVGLASNKIIEATGGEAIDYTKTLTKAVTDVVKPNFDTSKIQSEFIRNSVDDLNAGTNIFKGMTDRSSAYYNSISEEIKPRISVAAKIIGDVAQSAPQTAAMALPHGSIMYALSSLSGNISENVTGEKPFNQEIAYAMYKAGIDIGSESIFGLFGTESGILEGALSKALGSKTVPKVAQLIWSVVANASEEGAEEIIAYPFQSYVDWRYNYPDSPISEFPSYLKLDQWAQAGFVGFISGGMFSVATLATNIPDIVNKKKANNLIEKASEIMNKPYTEVTKDEVFDFADDYIDTTRPILDEVVSQSKSNRAMLLENYPITNPKSTLTGKLPTSQKSTQAEPITMPTEAVQKPVEAVAPTRTVNMPTAQAPVETGATEGVAEVTQSASKKERLSTTNADGTYNIPALEESARRLNIAMSNADNRGQRNKMNEKLKGIRNLIDYVKENPNYQKPDIKKMVQEQRDYVASQKAKMDNITAKSAETMQKQATKTVKKVYTVEQLQTAKGKLLKRLVSPLNDADKIDIQNKIAKIDKMLAKQKASISSLDAIASTPDSTDTSGQRMGIMSNQFDTVTNRDSNYKIDGITPEVQSALDATSKGQAKKTGTLADAVNFAKRNIVWGSVQVSNAYGDIKRAIRLTRTASSAASAKVTEIIKKSYGTIKGQKRDLMKKSILFLDMEENIRLGMKFKARHGVKSTDQLYRITDNIRQELAKPENETVKNALDTRLALNKAVVQELVDKGKKVGMDYSYMLNREYYVYNAVYDKVFGEASKALRKGGNKFFKREGSDNSYISNPIMLDFMSLNKVYKMIYKLEVLKEAVALDKSKSVTYDRITGKEIIPEGYIRVSKNEIIGNIGITNNIESAAHEHAIQFLEQEGIGRESKVGKQIIKSAKGEDFKSSVVIPIDVYNVIADEFTKKASKDSHRIWSKAVRMWKWTKIRSPFVVWKYNARNMAGDFEITFTARPKIILEMPKAIWELYQYYYRGNRENLMVMNHMDKTGGLSGLTINDLNDTEKIPDLGRFNLDRTKPQMALDVAKKVWSAITAEKFTNFREQILRYSAYLRLTKDSYSKLKQQGIDVRTNEEYKKLSKEYIRNQASQGNKVISYSEYLQLESNDLSKPYKPVGYMASSREEINSIKRIDDKNIKLSNDLLGAYDDVSALGSAVADNLIPFNRFFEISVKRYVRLVENTFYQEGQIINKEGASFAQKAGVTARIGGVSLIKIGGMAVRIGLSYAAMAMFNRLWAGDDEDKLPEDVKKQPHITFPSWLFGDNARVYYLSNLGIASGLLSGMGIQASTEDIISVISGKKTPKQVIDEMTAPNLASIIFSINPILIEGVELATGKSGYYFDPENPSQIRDRLEYVFRQAGFAQVYTKLAGLPNNKATLTDSIVANNYASGDVALWAVSDMVDDYNKQNGIEPPNISYGTDSEKWKKSNAAYYYKLAIKLNDTTAIGKYMAEYVALGGNAKTMDQSLQTLKPLQFMKATDKTKLIAQMTPEQKATYDRAVAYYNEIRAVDDKVFTK
jgi:hypothetical protein